MRKFSTTNIVCLTLLWIVLCYFMIKGQGVNFMSVFTVIASAIIIFVPVYKSKKKEKNNR